MVGFYCATPYHIFIALHLAMTKYSSKKKNIVIMNHFNDANKIAENIRDIGLFENVYLINQNSKTSVGKIKRLFRSYIIEKKIKKFASYKYREVIFFALDFVNYAYIIKKGGLSTVYAYGEDGIGTYLGNSIYEPSRIMRMILKSKGQEKLLDKVDSIHVFRTDMIGACNIRKLVEIPAINGNDEEFKNVIYKIWNTNSVMNDFKLIYLEQPYEELLGNKYIEEEKYLLEETEKIFDEDAIILKLHPRTNNKFKDKRKDARKIPFEMQLLDYDITKKYIISTFSTACMTPKMIFDQEPTIILTYKLYDCFTNYKNIENIERMIETLRKEYSDKNKIIIPETKEEYQRLLINKRGEKKC